jgi:hypothetical protein
MKTRSFLSKGLLIIMLLSFTIGATGCWPFGGEQDNTLTDEQVQQKRVGTLKSLGGMSVGEGTHLLEVSSGHTIRLKSNNIDLTQEKYLNKNVEVRGVLSKAEDGKDIMDVRSIDLVEDESQNGTQQEFRNADLGFSLTYLDSWKVETTGDEVTFTAPVISDSTTEVDLTEASDVIVIKRLPNPEKEPVETFLELPSDADELTDLGYTQSLIGVDKLEGLKKESSDNLKVNVWLTRNEYLYVFSFTGSDNANSLNNRNTFYSMLSTFQFIGMTEEEEEEEEEDNDDISTEEVENETAIPPIEEPEPVAKSEPVSSSSTYGVIAQYINETINTIAPEESESGTWKATNFEFVDPNYVYVEYSDGSEYRRVLLTYNQNGGLNTDVVGYFKPGETTSWQRVEGENPVESAEKIIVNLTDEGAQEAATVKEGYRYFESTPYDFNAQYPSNWYFSGTSGGGDVAHHYGFSNEPVENGNEKVSIDIVSGSLPSGSSVSVGSHTGIKVFDGSEMAIYIKRDDGLLYKIYGGSENEQYIIDMAASIQDL